MANELDELSGPVMAEGNDTNVIAKRIEVKIGLGSKIFDVMWWVLPPIIGGIVWSVMKVKAKNYFQQLQQKLQHDASQIDNYLEQRVQILKNCATLVEKAMAFDKETMTAIARLRSQNAPTDDESRLECAREIEAVQRQINIAVENYPELKAHNEIVAAMQQNAYLQKEITAAREVYNDTVSLWNREIFSWPTKQIVAAKNGYTTRIPFAIDEDTKRAARDNFFE